PEHRRDPARLAQQRAQAWADQLDTHLRTPHLADGESPQTEPTRPVERVEPEAPDDREQVHDRPDTSPGRPGQRNAVRLRVALATVDVEERRGRARDVRLQLEVEEHPARRREAASWHELEVGIAADRFPEVVRGPHLDELLAGARIELESTP